MPRGGGRCHGCVIRLLVGGDRGGGQQVGQGVLSGDGVGAQSDYEIAQTDPVLGVGQAGDPGQSRGQHRRRGSADASVPLVSLWNSLVSTPSVLVSSRVSPVRWLRSDAVRRWARCAAGSPETRDR
jgi:hypothetical protein